MIPQEQDATEKIAVPVLQRRNREADRHLVAPAGDEIAFATRALLSRRMTLLDQLDQPRLAFEDLIQRLTDCGCRRDSVSTSEASLK